MVDRELLFEFDSHKDDEFNSSINMIRVYSDGTYTADGRGKDIIEWKVENSKIFWKDYNSWQSWSKKDFYAHFIDFIDKQLLED
jgi:hypothetical protein